MSLFSFEKYKFIMLNTFSTQESIISTTVSSSSHETIENNFVDVGSN